MGDYEKPDDPIGEKALRRWRMARNGRQQISPTFLRALYVSPCVNCGATDNIHADHIVPIARGGQHSEENLQPLCRDCNLSKGASLPVEWQEEMAREDARNRAIVEALANDPELPSAGDFTALLRRAAQIPGLLNVTPEELEREIGAAGLADQ